MQSACLAPASAISIGFQRFEQVGGPAGMKELKVRSPSTRGGREVKVAVIPAAGRGTRWLPVTRAVPKELLPVGGKPMIQHAVEEAMAAGIETACIVTSPSKQILREYFLGPVRAAERNEPAIESLRRIRRGLELVFVTQEEPRGVADAVGRARDVVGSAPFALMLPDNVFFATEPAIGPVLAHHRPGRSVTALYRLTRTNASWFGNCGRTRLQPAGGGLSRIVGLQSKAAGFQPAPGRPVWVALARSVLEPRFFDDLERLRRERARDAERYELDDVPIFQRMARDGSFFGVKLRGRAIDVGNPRGYAAANWFFGRGASPA
jgi:UTP--glucose-1-phosphate uridylyltransferase